MPANNTGIRIGWLAGTFPGMLGHLYSPGKAYRADSKTAALEFMPYALDNGAWPAFTRGLPWRPEPWRDLLSWARNCGQTPLWCLVPDVVGDRAGTLASWDRWAPVAAEYGWPLAFAAQDGMSFDDVPTAAAVVFLGGSTEWKQEAIGPWCRRFPRVHVGRINTYRWLRVCEAAGAESCDGTGWVRGDNEQIRGLQQWLREVKGGSARDDQRSLSFDASDEPTAPGSKSSSIAAPVPCSGASSASPGRIDE